LRYVLICDVILKLLASRLYTSQHESFVCGLLGTYCLAVCVARRRWADVTVIMNRDHDLLKHYLVRECWRQGVENNHSIPVIETTIRKILLEDPVQKEDDVKKKKTNLL
jgi:hypothetical protein